MKILKKRFFVAAALSCVALVYMAGCQEEAVTQQTITNQTKSRLVAVKNVELRQQLDEKQETIERQEQKLRQCSKQNDLWQGRYKKGLKEKVDSILVPLMKKISELEKQNKRMKSQLIEVMEENHDLENRIKQLEK